MWVEPARASPRPAWALEEGHRFPPWWQEQQRHAAERPGAELRFSGGYSCNTTAETAEIWRLKDGFLSASIFWVVLWSELEQKILLGHSEYGYAWTGSPASESLFWIFLKIPCLGMLLPWELWGINSRVMILERLCKCHWHPLKAERGNQNFKDDAERLTSLSLEQLSRAWGCWTTSASFGANCGSHFLPALNRCPHCHINYGMKKVRQPCPKGHSSTLGIWPDEDTYCFPYQSGFLGANSRNWFQLT